MRASGRSRLRSCLHRQPAEQNRQILCLIESPQGLQGGVGPFLRPALADVAAEFPLHFGSVHWPFRETRRVVDFARNSLPVDEDRRHAGGGSCPRGENWLLMDGDLLHEGENAWI